MDKVDQSFRDELAQINALNSKMVEMLNSNMDINPEITSQLLKKEEELFDRKRDSKDLESFYQLKNERNTTSGCSEYSQMLSQEKGKGSLTEQPKVLQLSNGRSVLNQDNKVQ